MRLLILHHQNGHTDIVKLLIPRTDLSKITNQKYSLMTVPEKYLPELTMKQVRAYVSTQLECDPSMTLDTLEQFTLINTPIRDDQIFSMIITPIYGINLLWK